MECEYQSDTRISGIEIDVFPQKSSRSQTSSFPRKIRGDTNFAHCRGRYKNSREPCTYIEIYRLARNQMDAATCTTSAFDNCRAFFMKQLNNYHHFAKSKVHDKPQFLDRFPAYT